MRGGIREAELLQASGGGGMICMMSPQSMVQAVRMRAAEMTVMAAPDTDNTLIMLEGLMRTAGQLPGLKTRLHDLGRVLSERSQIRLSWSH